VVINLNHLKNKVFRRKKAGDGISVKTSPFEKGGFRGILRS
jgi:phosphotransferase system IIA component